MTGASNQIADQSLNTTSSPTFDQETVNSLILSSAILTVNSSSPIYTLTASAKDNQLCVYADASGYADIFLPDATTLAIGRSFTFTAVDGGSGIGMLGSVSISSFGYTYYSSIPAALGVSSSVTMTCTDNSTADGKWVINSQIPTTFPLQYNYGGTGLSNSVYCGVLVGANGSGYDIVGSRPGAGSYGGALRFGNTDGATFGASAVANSPFLSSSVAGGSSGFTGWGFGPGIANGLLYWSTLNLMSTITPANNGLLVTSATGVPSIGNAILANITVNTVTVGLGGGNASTSCALGTSAATLQSGAGLRNVSIGYQASYYNSGGVSNVSCGFTALFYNLGSYNSAVGDNALHGSTNLSAITYNCGFGYGAGASLYYNGTANTAAYNTFAGALSGVAVTQGSYNCGFGYNALTNAASGSLSLSTGTYNTALGYQASTNNAATVGAIAIGANAVATIATGSTSITNGAGIAIGSASYPVGVRGDGSLFPGNTAGGYWAPKINGTVYQIPLLASGTTGSVLLTSQTNTTDSGIAQYLAKGTGTEAANAVTINQQSGTITTSALTTAASGNYSITLTNSLILSSSNIIMVSIGGNGSNTTKAINVTGYCSAASTAVIVINNLDLVSALNGTVVINFVVY